MRNVPTENTITRSMTPTLLAALLLTLVAACSILPKTESVQLLDPQLPSPSRDAQAAAWTLHVMRPESDPTRDSNRVLVRTGRGQLQVHPSARWVAAAPELLRTLLVRYMRDASALDQVSTGAAGMDRTLTLDLRRFELAEAGEQSLQAEIRIEARLFDGSTGELLAHRLFERRAPVDAAEPDAIVRGFESVLGAIIPALADWLNEDLPEPGAETPG